LHNVTIQATVLIPERVAESSPATPEISGFYILANHRPPLHKPFTLLDGGKIVFPVINQQGANEESSLSAREWEDGKSNRCSRTLLDGV
jgi:hypothetical protein